MSSTPREQGEADDAVTTLAKALYSAYADGVINGGGGRVRGWDTLGDHQLGWITDARRELARLRTPSGETDAGGEAEPVQGDEQPEFGGPCPTCDNGEVHRPSSVPGDEGWEPCPACNGGERLPTYEEFVEWKIKAEGAMGDAVVAELRVKEVEAELSRLRSTVGEPIGRMFVYRYEGGQIEPATRVLGADRLNELREGLEGMADALRAELIEVELRPVGSTVREDGEIREALEALEASVGLHESIEIDYLVDRYEASRTTHDGATTTHIAEGPTMMGALQALARALASTDTEGGD